MPGRQHDQASDQRADQRQPEPDKDLRPGFARGLECGGRRQNAKRDRYRLESLDHENPQVEKAGSAGPRIDDDKPVDRARMQLRGVAAGIGVIGEPGRAAEKLLEHEDMMAPDRDHADARRRPRKL